MMNSQIITVGIDRLAQMTDQQTKTVAEAKAKLDAGTITQEQYDQILKSNGQ